MSTEATATLDVRICGRCGDEYEPGVERCAECARPLPAPVSVPWTRPHVVTTAQRVANVAALAALGVLAFRSMLVLGVAFFHDVAQRFQILAGSDALVPPTVDPRVPSIGLVLILVARLVGPRFVNQRPAPYSFAGFLVSGLFVFIVLLEILAGVAVWLLWPA